MGQWILLIYLALSPQPQVLTGFASEQACQQRERTLVAGLSKKVVVKRSVCLPAADVKAIARRVR